MQKPPAHSPKEVSELLQIPSSTLRRYSVAFALYLSPQSPGKKRVYTDSDVVTLGKIKELARKFPLEKIGPLLQVVEVSPTPPDNSLMLIPAFKAMTKELETLRAVWASDHERLDRLEKIAEWAALPWWRRLFTPPPK